MAPSRYGDLAACFPKVASVTSPRRRSAWICVLAAVAASVAVAGPTDAQGAAAARLAGADRIATAVAISQATLDPQWSTSAVVASGYSFPDALGGGALAAHKDAPLLLTAPTSLDPRVAAELQRAVVPHGEVFILGGTGALSNEVEEQIGAMGFIVSRLAGTDRYKTALAIADAIIDPLTIYLADGTNFQESMIAGAGAAREDGVLLLTSGSMAPQEVTDWIDGHDLPQVAVGTEARWATLESQDVFGSSVEETARLVAERLYEPGDPVGFSSSSSFADGLVAGRHVAANDGVLLLTKGDELSSAGSSFLEDHPDAGQLFVYGGTSAVNADVEEHLESLATGAAATSSTTTSSSSSTSSTSTPGTSSTTSTSAPPSSSTSVPGPSSTLPSDPSCPAVLSFSRSSGAALNVGEVLKVEYATRQGASRIRHVTFRWSGGISISTQFNEAISAGSIRRSVLATDVPGTYTLEYVMVLDHGYRNVKYYRDGRVDYTGPTTCTPPSTHALSLTSGDFQVVAGAGPQLSDFYLTASSSTFSREAAVQLDFETSSGTRAAKSVEFKYTNVHGQAFSILGQGTSGVATEVVTSASRTPGNSTLRQIVVTDLAGSTVTYSRDRTVTRSAGLSGPTSHTFAFSAADFYRS